jgi:hypothetical protein
VALLSTTVIDGPDGTVHLLYDDARLEWTGVEVRSKTKTELNLVIDGRALQRTCGEGTTSIQLKPAIPISSGRNWKNEQGLRPGVPFSIGSCGSEKQSEPPDTVDL